jgi:hypothetical protein
MRVFNYFFTIFLAVNVLFAGLYAISETQKFTGVRVYLLKKIDTDPPKILFESHIDGERVDAPFVDIRASITDNQTAS